MLEVQIIPPFFLSLNILFLNKKIISCTQDVFLYSLSASMISEARSAHAMTGKQICPAGTIGKNDASTTRRPLMLCTLK